MKEIATGTYSVRAPIPGGIVQGQQTYGNALADASLWIDAPALLSKLSWKAARNKNGKATMLNGAIVVKAKLRSIPK